MNGFRTRIFEMHKKKPGGLCTAWKRQGYTVNGCIHWLVGSGPRSDFHQIWTGLGRARRQDDRRLRRVRHGSRRWTERQFIIYTDIDRLERHMKEIAPEDSAVIDEFISAVREMHPFRAAAREGARGHESLDVLKMIVTNFGLLRMLWKWNKVSLTDFGDRFKNPLLREAFPLLFMPDFPMTFMLMTFAWMHNRSAGYPIGGSLDFRGESRSAISRWAER